MTKTEKILKLLEDNGLCVEDLTNAFFELRIDDVLACSTDFEDLEIKPKEYKKIIDDVKDDDEMWNALDDSIDYFIRRDTDYARQ